MASKKQRRSASDKWGCKDPACPNYKDTSKRFCPRCCSRKYRKANPIKDAFNNLKSSAAKRNIPFSLTFEEFAKWDKATGYTEKKGKDINSASVDRRNPNGGYCIGNIRIMTYGENAFQGSQQHKSVMDECEADYF